MKSLVALITLAIAVLALAFLLNRDDDAPAIVSSPALPADTVATPVEEQLRETLRVPDDSESPNAEAATPEARLAPPLALSREKLDWEKRIEAITSAADLDETAKARRLFSLFPSLPEQALTTAAEEAINRVKDADYAAIALGAVTNPQTHGLVESVLFADLMARPDTISLPTLLRIARTANHPYAPYARENLELLTGEDHGADWLKWEAAVQRSIASQK